MDQKVYYCVKINMLLVPVPRQLNPVHNFATYFYKNHFNIIIGLRVEPFVQTFQPKFHTYLSPPLYVPYGHYTIPSLVMEPESLLQCTRGPYTMADSSSLNLPFFFP